MYVLVFSIFVRIFMCGFYTANPLWKTCSGSRLLPLTVYQSQVRIQKAVGPRAKYMSPLLSNMSLKSTPFYLSNGTVLPCSYCIWMKPCPHVVTKDCTIFFAIFALLLTSMWNVFSKLPPMKVVECFLLGCCRQFPQWPPISDVIYDSNIMDDVTSDITRISSAEERAALWLILAPPPPVSSACCPDLELPIN